MSGNNQDVNQSSKNLSMLNDIDNYVKTHLKDFKQILLKLSILQIDPPYLWGKIKKCVFHM